MMLKIFAIAYHFIFATNKNHRLSFEIVGDNLKGLYKISIYKMETLTF